MASYEREGDDGLASTKATGRPPALSPKQQATLKRVVIGKNPLQLNFGAALWTLPIIRQFIEARFGVVLHDTTIARTLGRLGLTPQRPTRRAFQRDDAACEHWAAEEFPRIVRNVKRKQATLLFADESAIHEDGPVGTTWGARGQRPVVRVTGRRRKVNLISAISPRGRLWFRCFGGMLNAALFIEFLRALLRDVRGAIVLVIDKHPAHVAAATRRFIAAHASRLQVEFLPSYAPDMNPDEHVWSHLKGMFRQDPLKPDEDLIDAVKTSMNHIARNRNSVRAFFSHPEVAYVKAALNW
jgi:transposase